MPLHYVVAGKVFNKLSKQTHWILFNIEVDPEFRGYNIGIEALKKTHKIFLKELGIKSYIITIENYLMYKMIAREHANGVVDFYCLINTKYPVEEMKAEEANLERMFRTSPHTRADMIVSFDKDETEKVKSIYFKS